MSENSGTNANRYMVLGAAGSAIGLIAGMITRPTFLGIKIPLGVLTSKIPGDAPFKNELLTHLGMCLAAGAGVGLLIAFVVISMAPAPVTAKAASASPEAYDTKRWQALAEIDPDISAQVKRLAPFGQGYVDELAQKYLAIGDKTYLTQLADSIADRAESDLAARKAALMDRNRLFMGFRCYHDQQGRFIGEVSVDSGDFYVFNSQSDFEEAARNYVTRGRPPIASVAIGRATEINAAT